MAESKQGQLDLAAFAKLNDARIAKLATVAQPHTTANVDHALRALRTAANTVKPK